MFHAPMGMIDDRSQRNRKRNFVTAIMPKSAENKKDIKSKKCQVRDAQVSSRKKTES